MTRISETNSTASIPRTPRALWLLTFAVACTESTYQYSAEADTAAMRAISRVWSEGVPQGLQLSLCEDLAIDESLQDGCVVNHLVRGDGRGLDHEEPQNLGCGGGCTAKNVAFVKGFIEGAALQPPRAISGNVNLFTAGADGDDPYAYPYIVYLACDDDAAPCQIRGEIAANGSLELTFFDGVPGATNDTTHQLVGAAAATCPAPNL